MAKSIVPVYDEFGQVSSSFSIEEPLEYIDGRISRGLESGLYYKGAGVPYDKHYILEPNERYEVLGFSGIEYLGFEVVKYAFMDLAGIFEEKYQPQFSDFIGSCGNKELAALEHEDFKLSSMITKKAFNWDKTNNQYYLLVDYKCGRRKYSSDGDPVALKKLLEYMIQNDWNFIWDKTSINDVSYNGLVTDIADIFKSASLNHKLGTVYSILYSLGHTDVNQYHEFLSVLNYRHGTDMDYIFNAVRFLKDNGVDIKEMFVEGGDYPLYEHIVKNYLLTGKNCAHCSYTDLGEKVMNRYIEKFGENR